MFNIKLSVCIITYNQEKYISQAIESVLMQKTNFDFEILIGEDDSSDRTREIVLEYKKKYPNKIRTILNNRKDVIFINNKPTGRFNFINTFKSAMGDYIAILEGDDYWTNQNKIQMQVSYLDNNPEIALVFHRAKWLNQINSVLEEWDCGPTLKKNTYDLNDLLTSNFIPTCSIMVRNNYFKNIPNWFYSIPIADHPFVIMHAINGKIGYIDETLAVYRRHEKSIFGSENLINNLNKTIITYLTLKQELFNNKNDTLNRVISELYIEIAKLETYEGRYLKSIKKIAKSLSYAGSIMDIILIIKHLLIRDIWLKKLNK